jgi:hypothetical protein
MPNITPTLQAYEEGYDKAIMRWETLQEIVDSYNCHKKAYLDTPHSRGASETAFFKEYMAQYALCLLFLRVPIHHDKYGNAFVVRSECNHLLYPQYAEEILNEMNSKLGEKERIEEERAIREKAILSTKETKRLQSEIDRLVARLENYGYPVTLGRGRGYTFVGETGVNWVWDILNVWKEK